MKKQNNLNFIIYSILSSTFLNFILLNNLSISYFPKIAFLIPLICGAISIIFILFLPKQNNHIKRPNIFIKIISSLYYVIFSIIIIMLCSKIINFYFFQKTSFFLITLLISLIIILITSYSKKHIYDISLTLFLFVFLINVIMIFNTSFIDTDLIYNIKLNATFNNNYLLLIPIIYITLDPIQMYLSQDLYENVNIRNSLIVSTIISSIVSSFLIFINYLYYSDTYLYKQMFPSFAFINSLLGPEFLDYFTILILIITFTYTLLKVSFNISVINSYFKKTNLASFLIVMFIFVNTNILFKYPYIEYRYLGSLLTVLVFIIYIWIIINKEAKNNASSKT